MKKRGWTDERRQRFKATIEAKKRLKDADMLPIIDVREIPLSMITEPEKSKGSQKRDPRSVQFTNNELMIIIKLLLGR